MRLLDYLPDGVRHPFDALSLTVLLASIVNLLPSIASLLTIVWSAIRIYETATVQRLIRRRKEKP